MNKWRNLFGKDKMDRRQKKTRDAIFHAFSELLRHKKYENITVQEIIDCADIGRSTFYSHFETKDMLLKSMCCDIFDHIFKGDICDYHIATRDLEAELGHLLWHLKEHKADISGIFLSESSDLFMGYLKECLAELFKRHLVDFKIDVPTGFLLNHLVGSFTEVIKWWVGDDMLTQPEMVAKYFIAVTETH